jgi:AbrB family looped-hinge helix DNA binding protein
MSTIIVSSKYRIVIPAKIREALGIKPGERLHAIEYRGRIELVPVRPAKAARGLLRVLAPLCREMPIGCERERLLGVA